MRTVRQQVEGYPLGQLGLGAHHSGTRSARSAFAAQSWQDAPLPLGVSPRRGAVRTLPGGANAGGALRWVAEKKHARNETAPRVGAATLLAEATRHGMAKQPAWRIQEAYWGTKVTLLA